MLLFSLMNNSDVIRWSLDMRWQRADRDVGFYDLKQGIRMRSSTDPNFVIDWKSWEAVNRHERRKEGPDTSWHSTAEVRSMCRDDMKVGVTCILFVILPVGVSGLILVY